MKKHLLLRIGRFLRPYLLTLAGITVLMVASNLLVLAIPLLSGWALDAVGTESGSVDVSSVLRNCAVNKSTLHIDKRGRHTLRIRVGDPGIVLQKIVLDFGGMKRSYLGPQSTLIE